MKKIAIWVDEVLGKTNKALHCRIAKDNWIYIPDKSIGDIWKDGTLFPDGVEDEDLIYETDVCMTVDEWVIDDKAIPDTHIVDDPAYGD